VWNAWLAAGKMTKRNFTGSPGAMALLAGFTLGLRRVPHPELIFIKENQKQGPTRIFLGGVTSVKSKMSHLVTENSYRRILCPSGTPP
jgi:hypothetical protein